MISSFVISFNFVVYCYQISITTLKLSSILSLTFVIESLLLYCSISDHARSPSGKWLGSRQIRCNWATKGAGSNDDKQSSDVKSIAELTNGSSGECSYPMFNEVFISSIRNYKFRMFQFVVLFTLRIIHTPCLMSF